MLASYYSHKAGIRVVASSELIHSFIGVVNPPCKMMMKVRMDDGDIIHCHPKHLICIKTNVFKSLNRECKSIW